jgi:hypothetical protein
MLLSQGRTCPEAIAGDAGGATRALHILFVCVVRHVKLFDLSHTQIPPVAYLTKRGQSYM